jgi:hypothetical protein
MEPRLIRMETGLVSRFSIDSKNPIVTTVGRAQIFCIATEDLNLTTVKAGIRGKRYCLATDGTISGQVERLNRPEGEAS